MLMRVFGMYGLCCRSLHPQHYGAWAVDVGSEHYQHSPWIRATIFFVIAIIRLISYPGNSTETLDPSLSVLALIVIATILVFLDLLYLLGTVRTLIKHLNLTQGPETDLTQTDPAWGKWWPPCLCWFTYPHDNQIIDWYINSLISNCFFCLKFAL